MFDSPQPFIHFGLSHILVIICTFVLVWVVYISKSWHQNHQKTIAKILAISGLIFYPIHFISYFFFVKSFDIRFDLPLLQVCGVVTISTCLYFITKKQFFYNIVYFWGFGAMLASFFTPALTEDFPHIYFWLFWLSHWAIVYVMSFMIMVLPKKIRYQDVWVAFAALLGYSALIYPIDILTNSNYGFLIQKPDIINFGVIYGVDFDQSPIYLIPAAIISLLIFHLVYTIKILLSKAVKTQSGIKIGSNLSNI